MPKLKSFLECVRSVADLNSSVRFATYLVVDEKSSGDIRERRPESMVVSTEVRIKGIVVPPMEIHFSYSSGDQGNELVLVCTNCLHEGREGSSYLLMLKSYVYEGLQEPIRPVLHRWTHWCVVVGPDLVSLFVNGVNVSHSPRLKPLQLLPLNGTVVLGQEQDIPGGGFVVSEIFRGYLADVNIWSSELDPKQISSMAACSASLIGDVFSTDVAIPIIMKAKILEKEFKSFCQLDELLTAVPYSAVFVESAKLCKYLGSSIFGPNDREQNMALRAVAENFSSSCAGSFWVGITDAKEEGIWRDYSSEKILPTFFDSHPGGGEERDCASMIVQSGNWHNEPCSAASPRCVACAVTHSGTLSLKGLCFTTHLHSLFDLQGYVNGEPYFHGFNGYLMYKTKEGSWSLFNAAANLTLAETVDTYGKAYPVGRTIWKMQRTMCGLAKGELVVLGMSTCAADQFMCSSGECVHAFLRCDAIANCEDQTDELNCDLVDPPKGYLKHVTPINHVDWQLPLPLNVTVTIKRFTNIIDYKHIVDLEVAINLKWQDSRLIFNNLKNNIKRNSLRDDELDSIWKPTYHFTNVQDGLIKIIDQRIHVERISDPLPRDFNDVDMNTRYSGTGAVLTENKLYSGSFSCKFDVFFYPLDEQTCSVQLELVVGKPTEMAVWYHGDRGLQQFQVQDCSISAKQHKDKQTITVLFTLGRMPSFILLSVMLPTLMLLIIGYSTLYIKPSLLQVRLTVSLTTLLVLYTLFSQTSSSLPRTAHIKMIDMWFFFVISVLFVIIILHVVIERIGDDLFIKSTTVKDFQSKGSFPSRWWGSISKALEIPSDAPEKVLFVARVYVIPLIVIPVIIAFWVVMVI
ncbi:Low-density lipoprotein (LDL) receptor class A repeat [Trinorchestia longiramus]|nr:Low-density lipoprotein (LDL) receptor class A repeat [Trinorchestia longiramus]